MSEQDSVLAVDIVTRLEKCEAIISRLTEEMYKQRCWERPPVPAPQLPETDALNVIFFDEPGTGFVHVRYEIDCPAPACQQIHKELVIRVLASTPNPFKLGFRCPKTGSSIKVLFNRDKPKEI